MQKMTCSAVQIDQIPLHFESRHATLFMQAPPAAATARASVSAAVPPPPRAAVGAAAAASPVSRG